ncbi:CD99 antigen-like protein 2 [Cyprinodon tularosa]|uniref:CD99 antigen-like protein 2 n=1 Tax=Cyprinodon tularosa TaxID=77115 RepID=UPI0018E2470F|nr:CD99 antigen-like protein 2 [Cyprinodon tularosa]
MLKSRPVWTLLLLLLLPLQVVSQGDFDLTDALDDGNKPAPTSRPGKEQHREMEANEKKLGELVMVNCYDELMMVNNDGKLVTVNNDGELVMVNCELVTVKCDGELVRVNWCLGCAVLWFSAGISLEDLLNVGSTSRTTTKAPAKVRPKKPQSSPGGNDFNLADALDENQKPGGGFSDTDLEDVSKDKGYKPDKGKGYGQKDDSSQSYDGNSEMTAEVGTIAGIISAVSVALVGAISSYISYQKKKLCFSLQQSLDLDLNKAEIPGQVAAEPHAQQSLLDQPKAEASSDQNVV